MVLGALVACTVNRNTTRLGCATPSMGVWCNGNITVSKTVVESSSLSTPAKGTVG